MKPISQTAFYCCGVRMQDAESAKPICGDVYAKVFMNEDGLRILEKFKDEVNPNTSNVARARVVDELLRDEVKAYPRLHRLLIGLCLDSRAHRLKRGFGPRGETRSAPRGALKTGPTRGSQRTDG